MAEIYQFKHSGEQIDELLDKAETAVQPREENGKVFVETDGLVTSEDEYYYLPRYAPANDPQHTFAMASDVQATDAKLTELSEETSTKFEKSAESVAERFEVLEKEVANIKPIINQGTINNAADEEDITSADSLLKLKDRTDVSGKGYVIIRKNKSFAEQVTKDNTIYEVRYEHDLGGATITMPNNSVLKFNGGKLTNGNLANVGVCENALDGFCVGITSFADSIDAIRTSWYSVNAKSEPSHNQSVLQTALNNGISIIIDTTHDGFSTDATMGEGIILNEPLHIVTGNVAIKGETKFGGTLAFPYSDGFVFSAKIFCQHIEFDNLSISSKGHCFNFCNETEEGVANPTRPYNIYFSSFTNLKVKSLTKDCFYQGDLDGVGGDPTPIFSVLFDNIYFWTTRYGFNGIHGQTDFVVQNIRDIYVPNAFFRNSCPNIVRNLNSSFGEPSARTTHFMIFEGDLTNYGIAIKCEECSWEGYQGEVFYDASALDGEASKRRYELSLNKCAFAYYSSDFSQGIDIYPILLPNVKSLHFNSVRLPSVKYKDGYSLALFTESCESAMSSIDFEYHYGRKSAGGAIGKRFVWSVKTTKTTDVGTYPDFSHAFAPKVILADVIEQKMVGMVPHSIDVTGVKTFTIVRDLTHLSATADTTIDYILYSPYSDDIGAKSDSSRLFGRIIYLYNSSSYNILFNEGYENSVVDPQRRQFRLRPKEYAVIMYDGAKTKNRYIVIARGNDYIQWGNTNSRPTLAVYEEGFEYYDSTLKKKILWNGQKWVNLDGTDL